jgi:hypothetical protein
MHCERSPLAILCRDCGNGCGCPEVHLTPDAPADQQVVITDDFGQQIQMSADQFGYLIEKARAGVFDQAFPPQPVR